MGREASCVSVSPTQKREYGATDTVSVKAVVLAFKKFPTLVPVPGPEMQSTGETMGIAEDFATALRKARVGAGYGPEAPVEIGIHPSHNSAARL